LERLKTLAFLLQGSNLVLSLRINVSRDLLGLMALLLLALGALRSASQGVALA
jgi:hypothetical protein